MAKAKVRRGKRSKRGGGAKIQWGGPAGKGTAPVNVILGVAAATAVIAAGAYFWQSRETEARFIEFVKAGQAALTGIETLANDGRSHLQPGQGHRYGSAFPTSGPHAQVWTTPGVYDTPQPPTLLVHALEHGNIVIYYDRLDPQALDMLKDWAGLYTGQWDGVVLTPSPGLGSSLMLTAWRKTLLLDTFDPAATAAFIDAYRGRGPENPVR